MVSEPLGHRIEQARAAKGYTVSQLARRMGVKPGTLKNWESDRSEPRANKLTMLSGVLNVSTRWLLEGGSEIPNETEGHFPETGEINQKLEQLMAIHQRATQLLNEIVSDVARLQKDLDEEAEETTQAAE